MNQYRINYKSEPEPGSNIVFTHSKIVIAAYAFDAVEAFIASFTKRNKPIDVISITKVEYTFAVVDGIVQPYIVEYE